MYNRIQVTATTEDSTPVFNSPKEIEGSLQVIDTLFYYNYLSVAFKN